MIPRPDIAKWQANAPWKEFMQVEQDLVISRTLVELFSDDFLRENLAFRGGTALHKLYLAPAPRYSEDISGKFLFRIRYLKNRLGLNFLRI